MSAARIEAVTCVELTNVVVLAAPLKFTVAPVTNPVPLTVSVNPAAPAVALVGEIVVIAGGGLVTGKLTVPEVPPPGAGLLTNKGSDARAAISVVETWIVSCVALTNVVVRAVPLKLTTEEWLKLVPFTVSVKAAPPTVALAGESVETVGNGLFTVNGEFADVPPPGAGFATVTLNVPAFAIAAAVMEAVICVALTNVVVAAVPLKFTTDPETKFVPLTVSVNPAPPAVALVGDSDVIVGEGKLTVVGSLELLFVVPVSPTDVTFAVLIGVPAAAAAMFTTKLNALVPPAAIVAELVQVTGDPATQVHTPELVLLLNVIPAGNESVTVVVPLVGAPPELVTVIV